MEDLTKPPFSSMPDDYVSLNEKPDMIARDSIPLPPHNTSEMDEQNSSSQFPQFGYIPIVLDLKNKENLQDCSPTPVSDAVFSDNSWVEEAWKVDSELLSKSDGTLEHGFLDIGHCSQRIPGGLSPDDLNEFDEAFGSFCNSSPLNYDLPSSSSESSGNAHNACDITQRNEPRSLNQGTPDIIITEAWKDAHRPRPLREAMHGTVNEQHGSSAKPFLENPIQTHYTQCGKTEYLVRLSHCEVQLRMPDWLKLYEEQRKLLEEHSRLPGSRASLPKRKR